MFLTRRLLFLDGRGHGGAVLHPCHHDDLRGLSGDHGRGGRRHGDGALLGGLLRGLRGDGDPAVLVQLPLHRALDLSAEEKKLRQLLRHVSPTLPTGNSHSPVLDHRADAVQVVSEATHGQTKHLDLRLRPFGPEDEERS